jgi:hypothetical protein
MSSRVEPSLTAFRFDNILLFNIETFTELTASYLIAPRPPPRIPCSTKLPRRLPPANVPCDLY